MKQLTDKFDSTGGPTGQLDADEFNDMRKDAQNVVSGSGQTLTVALEDDNRQMAKSIAQGGDLRSVADTETALIGETVIPGNGSGAITIKLPLTSATKPLYDGAVVLFTETPPALYSINSVTFDAQTNTVGPTAQTVEVTTDDILGGFRWDATNSWWIPIIRQSSGTNF